MIMESADHIQDEPIVGSSSSSSSACCYGVIGRSTTHDWTPNSILNTNIFNTYPINDQLSSDYYLSRVKEEFSDNYYLKYTEILSSSSSSSTTDHEFSLRTYNEETNNSNDIETKLLLKSFSSGNPMDKIQLSPGDLSSYSCYGRGFSQIFPSLNFSNSNHDIIQEGLANIPDMNLQALDLLPSSRFTENFSLDHNIMQQSCLVPLYSSNKISSAAEAAKRSSSKMEPKPIQNAPKKSRLEARASCPPLKVRKEKLGDRIAALQQLVAPFGKTDTSSVLMEAIGYIKFLQNQVETLSVPYMKKSHNKTTRVTKAGPAESEIEEPKRDLKSRGLCLVPLSCMSYITDGGGGGGAVVWPPPHFGGATY